MNETLERDLTKLPRWAQQEIAGLRSRLAAAEDAIQAALGAAPTPVMLDPHAELFRGFPSDPRRPLYLAESRMPIHITLANKVVISIDLARNPNRAVEAVEVRSLDSSLAFEPRFSNAGCLRAIPWGERLR